MSKSSKISKIQKFRENLAHCYDEITNNVFVFKTAQTSKYNGYTQDTVSIITSQARREAQ